MVISPFSQIDMGPKSEVRTTGRVSNFRNTMYVEPITDVPGEDSFGTKYFNVTLQSEIIASNVRILGKDNPLTSGAYVKIVHHFSAKFNRFNNPEVDLNDKEDVLRHSIFYSQISYTTGLIDNQFMDTPQLANFDSNNVDWNFIDKLDELTRNAGAMFYRYEEYEDCVTQVAISIPSLRAPITLTKDDFKPENVEKARQGAVFFDIPDPRYPGVYVYTSGNASIAIMSKSMYEGSELLKINDLKVNWVYKDESYFKNKKNRAEEIRRTLMSLPDPENNQPDEFIEELNLRLLAKAIAMDFMKDHIISLLEESEFVIDYDIFKGVSYSVKKVVLPFNGYINSMKLRMKAVGDDFLHTIRNEFNNNMLKAHKIRITIHDYPYKTVVKVSDFTKLIATNNIAKSQVVEEMSKAENALGYVTQNLYQVSAPTNLSLSKEQNTYD